MSLRSGRGALSIQRPSPARLRAMGERGRQTVRENRAYSNAVPF